MRNFDKTCSGGPRRLEAPPDRDRDPLVRGRPAGVWSSSLRLRECWMASGAIQVVGIDHSLGAGLRVHWVDGAAPRVDNPYVGSRRCEDGRCLTAYNDPPSGMKSITICGRVLHPTAVFQTYWRFAAARQAIYLARLRDSPLPWTGDEVLRAYRFTNVFRASDRVSQFLISEVQRAPEISTDLTSVVFRTLLFKIFNREDTWLNLESKIGTVTWQNYDFDHYCSVLNEASSFGPIYSAAYMMASPRLGENRKHANHLRLVETMMREDLPIPFSLRHRCARSTNACFHIQDSARFSRSIHHRLELFGPALV